MTARYQHVTVDTAEQWRAWLHDHHADTPGIWLTTWKKGHGPYVPYDDIVDHAVCYGWVDSRPRSLDADRGERLLTPRRPGSSWSRVNKVRVQRLTAHGLMDPAGLAAVAAAQQDGSWGALDDVETLTEPADLSDSLDGEPSARANWDRFPRSTKRAILEWINTARTDATRQRRIATTVTEAAHNRRANQWRQPGQRPTQTKGSS